MPLLEVKGLSVGFQSDRGIMKALRDVSFSVEKGRTLGIVGESGCGKSVTARSIMRLISPPGKIANGEIVFRQDGEAIDLVELDPMGAKMRATRGNEIAMIFQEPMTSLNPAHKIGRQISEPLILHRHLTRRQARDKSVALLESVGIPAPEARLDYYPHQLSGGMRQRVMIAMALSCDPVLLIADEPTTALDVTIQAQVLKLMNDLRASRDSAVLFITHDLGVIANMADDVVVMYLGRIVESAPVLDLFRNPKHPYTIGLMNSVPSMALTKRTRLVPIPGNVPSPLDKPSGCGFASRCSHVMKRCHEREPPLNPVSPDHTVACWLHETPAP